MSECRLACDFSKSEWVNFHMEISHPSITARFMISNEKVWFQLRLREGLEKTRKIFSVLSQEFTPIHQFETLKDVENGLGEIAWEVFCSLYSEKEFQELQSSQEAIQQEDASKVRGIRIARQKSLIQETRSVGIDCLDKSVAEELKTMMDEFTQKLGVVIGREEEEDDNDNGGEEDQEKEEEEKSEDDDVLNKKKKSKKRSGRKSSGMKRGNRGEHDRTFVMREAQKPQKKVKVVLKKVVDEDEDDGRLQDMDIEDSNVEEENQDVEKKKGKEEQSHDENLDEDEEEQQNEEEEEQQVEASQILSKMTETVPVARELLKLSGGSVPVGKLVPPDPRDAQPEQGELLLKDQLRLISWLNDQLQIKDLVPTEKLARLLAWWRVCDRSFTIGALLDHLRQKHKRSFQKKYQELKVKLEKQGVWCCSYTMALKYEKLCKFLCEYPLFIYQLELVSISAWSHWLAKDRLIKDPTFLHDAVFWRRKTPPPFIYFWFLSPFVMCGNRNSFVWRVV
jgi:hypothetical protein